MPIARFQLPDGRIAKFEVPEGTTPEQAQAEIEKHLATVPAPTTAPKQSPVTEAELLAGSPAARFAMGAASPILGAAQLGAEALGDKTGSQTLRQVEEMKKRGMSSAAELQRLKHAKELFSKLPGYEAQIARINEHIAELEKAPSSGGFDLAGTTGTVLSPAVLAAMKIPMAGSVLGRAGQGAAVGAGLGAASPVTEDDFWSAKGLQTAIGAGIGAVVPPAIEGVSKALSVGRRLLDPKAGAARILSEAAGDKRPAVEAALEQNRVYVPGSQPTSAEAAAPAGSPTFSALQNVARQKYPDTFSDIGKAQEAARTASIRSFGKTEAELEAAITARKAATDPLYKAAREAGDVVDTKPIIRDINEILNRNPGNRELVTELMNIRKGLMDKKLPRSDAQQVASVLDGMKAAMIKEDNKFILGKLVDLKTTLRDAIPGMKEADTAFAKLSAPINEMQVGQGLERSLTKPIGEGERTGVFAQAMRDEARTVQRATDFTNVEKLEDVLSPESLAKAKNVLSDLARKSEQERLSSLGRSRATEITGMPNPLPGVGPFQQEYTTIRAVLSRITKGVTDRTIKEVADALAVPEKALKLLRSAPDKYQQNVMDQIIAQRLGRGAIAASTEMATQ